MISKIENPELKQEYLNKLKKNLIKDENVKKLKSTIRFEETLKRFNKKKSKDLIVNDLQHEITVVKQEIIELENEFKTIKSDKNNLKQELLLLKLIKTLININLIMNKMSTKMEMNPVNSLFFLIKVLLMFSLILNLLLSIKYFFQNGLQKLKLLFLLIIISLLLP